MYKHTVIYIGRTKVFTDRTFTEKIDHALRGHQEEGWELVNSVSRTGPLGDVSGMWLFFKRPAEAQAEPAAAAVG